MKKNIVKYKLFVGSILIFFIFGCLSVIALNDYCNNQKGLISGYNKDLEKCTKLDENTATKEEKYYCDIIKTTNITEFDMRADIAYDVYVVGIFRKSVNELIIPFIIIIGSSYYITKYLRNRIILNDINRIDYKKIVKKLFLSSWKYALLIPLTLIMIFFIIFCFVGVNGVKIGLYDFDGTIFENNLLLYFLTISIQSFILSMIYINISLIIARREHNYILAVIKSYVVVIGLELFFETVLSSFFYKLFNSELGLYFNILNIYNYTYYEGNFNELFVLIGILLFSFIPLLLCYRNKEQLIIASEKNNKDEE